MRCLAWREKWLQKQLVAVLAGVGCSLALAQEGLPGRDVASLLRLAREANPEYASMRHEADAAAEKIEPAGALADPRLRTELMDISRGGQQNPTLLPARVGSARYTLMQDIPWSGKRDLKREMAALDAQTVANRSLATWSDIAARIKTTFAQLYYIRRNERLSHEILDLMVRLEKIAQVRYAGGLAAQQDVIRAQVEQTAMRGELIALEAEHHHLHTRMNALLARPAAAPLADPDTLRALPPADRLEATALAEQARARNPVLAVEASRVGSALKGRELAYKNRYPDFTVGVVPNQMQNSFRQWDVMLEVTLPLQQSSRRAQEREAQAWVAAAEARQAAAANQVLSDLSENLSAMEAARRSEALATHSQLPQAELTFQAALAGYETGKVDFATLLDAQRQIRQARQSQIRAQAEAQVRLAEIERLTGEDL